MTAPLWLFDLDGTIANSSHRRHFAEANDWANWYQRHLFALDAPIPEVLPFFSAGRFRFGEHAFLTGRSELSRDWTLTWLVKHGFATPTTPLYMRSPHDEGSDRIHEIKRQALREMSARQSDPSSWLFHRRVIFFEDHDATVATIRGDEALSHVTVVHAPHETVAFLEGWK